MVRSRVIGIHLVCSSDFATHLAVVGTHDEEFGGQFLFPSLLQTSTEVDEAIVDDLALVDETQSDGLPLVAAKERDYLPLPMPARPLHESSDLGDVET